MAFDIFSKLTCKKCDKKNAYELIKEKASEDLDRTGTHKKFVETWKCKFCGDVDVVEGEDHLEEYHE
jgi:hypothetical protein